MSRLLALTICLVAGACGSISKDYPQKTFYAFEVSRAERLEAAPDAPILLVQRFRTGALSQGQGLVYRTGPSTYEADYYSEFFTEPEDLLTLEVTDWMRDSGIFSATLGGSAEVEPDYVLEGSLQSLYVDQVVKGETRAVIDVQFFLTRRDKARSETLWHRDFQRSERAASPSGADVLDAWNRGLAEMLAEAELELRAAVSGRD